MAMRIRNLRHPCTIPNLHRFAPPKVFRGASSAARHVPCAAPPPRPPPLYRCTAPCAGPTIRPSIGVLHLTSPAAPTRPRPPPLTGVPAPPHHPTRPPLVLAVQMGRCRGVADPEENGSGGLLTFQIELTDWLISRRIGRLCRAGTQAGMREEVRKNSDVWWNLSRSAGFSVCQRFCQTNCLTGGPSGGGM